MFYLTQKCLVEEMTDVQLNYKKYIKKIGVHPDKSVVRANKETVKICPFKQVTFKQKGQGT